MDRRNTPCSSIRPWILDVLLAVNDDFGPCGLRYAVKHHDNETVKALLEGGAQVNVLHCRDRRTPLHYAAEYKNSKALEMLIGQPEVCINQKDVNKDTPLHVAVRSGCLEIVKMLLEARAEFEVKNLDGVEPVQIARDANMAEVLALLEDKYGELGREPPT